MGYPQALGTNRMGNFASSHIRNIALLGHGGSGKTSLAEALLFTSGTTSRLGSVNEQTSMLDYEPEEHSRGGSIATSLAWIEHDGHKLNLLDTPGDQNFIYDSLNAMRGADVAVVVVSAPDGIEVQTEQVFNEAVNLDLPRAIFINKMDRDRANVDTCLREIEETLGVRPVALQVPIGSESSFEGVISLFQRKALIYKGDGSGRYEKTDIPRDLIDEVDAAYEVLTEAVAETDEELLEIYLETFELSEDQIKTAFRDAVKKGLIVPILYGSATRCMGSAALLELATWAFPSPLERRSLSAMNDSGEVEVSCTDGGEFLAQVIHTSMDFQGKCSVMRIFRGDVPGDHVVENHGRGANERLGSLFSLRGKDRTVQQPVPGDILAVAKLKSTRTGDTLSVPSARLTLPHVVYPAPMMAFAVTPASKSDADKFKVAIDRLMEEDPTLTTTVDGLSGKLILNGMGQAHLDMAIERMSRKYKVDVTHELPPVPYRETLRKPAHHVEGKHKKQTGGAGQYGVAFMNVMPLPRDGGFEFIDKIKGGSIPNQFIPSVQKGVRSRMKNGFLAGYPIVDLRIELLDGKYHPVDSKDEAFQMAGSKGLKAAFEQGGTVLLEPMVDMQIIVPSEVIGDIMGDISARRGRITVLDPKGKKTIITATCPMAEVQRYAPDLKGMSAGKGSFTMSISGYEEVPMNLIQQVVSASPFKRDDEDE
jgi:elongation factor G